MLIHTTLLNETFGLAVVEGLLAGLPVVTYGVGGIADYLPLNNADIGYVAPEPSLGSLVDTALNALNDRKNGIALRGKQYAEDNMLTVKGMAARFQRLYCKLLNSLPQQTMDHRRRMTVLARDTEGVLAFNLGSAHRLSTNISVHKAWFLRNRRLRNHRGIPLNECCCGNCALKMGEDWQKWFSLRRKISMDYYQNFSTEQYLDLTRCQSKYNAQVNVPEGSWVVSNSQPDERDVCSHYTAQVGARHSANELSDRSWKAATIIFFGGSKFYGGLWDGI